MLTIFRSVAVLIFNEERDSILMTQKVTPVRACWNIVNGKIQEDETITQTARNKTLQETGQVLLSDDVSVVLSRTKVCHPPGLEKSDNGASGNSPVFEKQYIHYIVEGRLRNNLPLVPQAPQIRQAKWIRLDENPAERIRYMPMQKALTHYLETGEVTETEWVAQRKPGWPLLYSQVRETTVYLDRNGVTVRPGLGNDLRNNGIFGQPTPP